MSKGIHLVILGHHIDLTVDRAAPSALPPIATDLVGAIDGLSADEKLSLQAHLLALAGHVHLSITRGQK